MRINVKSQLQLCDFSQVSGSACKAVRLIITPHSRRRLCIVVKVYAISAASRHTNAVSFDRSDGVANWRTVDQRRPASRSIRLVGGGSGGEDRGEGGGEGGGGGGGEAVHRTEQPRAR